MVEKYVTQRQTFVCRQVKNKCSLIHKRMVYYNVTLPQRRYSELNLHRNDQIQVEVKFLLVHQPRPPLPQEPMSNYTNCKGT